MLKREDIEIRPLFIDYGQLAASAEWEAVQNVCRYLNIHSPVRLDVSDFGKLIPSGITSRRLDVKKAAFLPTRNLLFLTLGAAYAYSNDIYFVAVGLLSDAIFPDQTRKFVSYAQKAISEALGANLKILTPLAELNKVDVIRLAMKHSFPIDITYSCHLGSERACGHCISCEERISAIDLIKESDEQLSVI